MARYDISRGVYKVSLPFSPWSKELRQTLKGRYGITATSSMGCFTTVSEMTYRSGYSSVLRPALMEKFGRDVVKASADQQKPAKCAACLGAKSLLTNRRSQILR